MNTTVKENGLAGRNTKRDGSVNGICTWASSPAPSLWWWTYGSILVFQDEIDIALNKELFESLKGQHCYSIEEIVPVVQQKYPGKGIGLCDVCR